MPQVTEACVSSITQSLERINLGTPEADLGLQTWPLLGPHLDSAHYLLLDPSVKQGKCEIKETAREAVDSVMVINKSEPSIFALHGQLLRGAKQNRAINLTTMFLGTRKPLFTSLVWSRDAGIVVNLLATRVGFSLPLDALKNWAVS